ncbi:FAD:protein FMN transferase [Faecalicatena contorta]|uniref:FAD:protein FMN transferase n=1 Tax=Faecalicatena contorta TaxID=39482 RepID=UPI000D6DB822|nr:FAD:protein FMN transferase [Faecalicatena contorta]
MKYIRKSGLLLIILLTVVLMFTLSACSKPPLENPIKTTGIYFDTVISVEIWGSTDETILEYCEDICAQYEQLLSRTIETSDISRINSAGGAKVQVDAKTAEVIRKGLYYSQLSEGGFDITIAPLSELWDIKNNPGNIPAQSAIDEAKSHVNYKNVVLEGNTVSLKDPEAAIDLGAIAKGFIADELKVYLTEQGIEHALINLGGNILAVGGKTDGENFHIGIQKPFDERNTVMTSVDVNGKSVVSSGTYERYFKKDGKIYHHLLNPSTGYPFDNNLLQVTIISDLSVDGDGLSTTCFALGLEQGTALIESLDGISAIFITEDYSLHYAG